MKKRTKIARFKIEFDNLRNRFVNYSLVGVSLPRMTKAVMVSATIAVLIMELAIWKPEFKSWLSLIVDPTPEWYMQTYYNTTNKLFNKPEECNEVAILDIPEMFTRRDLADLLMILFQGEETPKAVGVDCTFSQSRSYDSIQTNYLIQTAEQLYEFPIVWAAVSNKKSAIPDSLVSHKGFVDFIGFYDYQEYKNDMPHLAVEIVSLAGYDISQIDTTTFLVNYQNKLMPVKSIRSSFRDSPEALIEFAKNKIIIIGGIYHSLDQHSSPFVMDFGKRSISGSTIVAYAVASLLTIANNSNFGLVHSPYYHYYSKTPIGVDIILAILLSFFYVWIYGRIDRRQIISKTNTTKRLIIFIKPVLLLLAVTSTLLIAMIVTYSCHKVPNVILFMTMTAFLGYFYELFRP